MRSFDAFGGEQAHAHPQRHRCHPSDRAPQPPRRGAGAHHARRRRLRVRGDAGRRAGLPVKGADKAEIFRAVQAIASGEAIFGPAIAQRVIEYFSAPQIPSPPLAFPELTDREREVLDLIAQGHNNDTIARAFPQPKTIRTTYPTSSPNSRSLTAPQAIVRARQAGLGQPDRPGPGFED